MDKGRLIKVSIIVTIILVVILYIELQRRNNHPKIIIIPKFSNRFDGITLPPIGIFMDTRTVARADFPNRKRHEMAHWKQFQSHGLFGFYIGYLINSYKYGYKNNPWEIEAKIAAGQQV